MLNASAPASGLEELVTNLDASTDRYIVWSVNSTIPRYYIPGGLSPKTLARVVKEWRKNRPHTQRSWNQVGFSNQYPLPATSALFDLQIVTLYQQWADNWPDISGHAITLNKYLENLSICSVVIDRELPKGSEPKWGVNYAVWINPTHFCLPLLLRQRGVRT